MAAAAVMITANPMIAGATEKASGSTEYAKGNKVGDFTVDSVTDSAALDSKITVFTHNATGAKVELISNDDPNRYFMMEFETPALDNKGTSHVFEHSAMNGSVKYPSRSLVPALRSRSYITFLNASTRGACTLYPVASLSEKQLLKLADFYADLCFEPMILEDEDIFRAEAWRLSLEDPDADLRINGTIYSEMSGKYSADMAAVNHAMDLLYPGCVSSYAAGGIPQDILTLKYDEIKKYHETYYKPSNCIAYLYGDIEDPGAFLDLLDGYFDAFDDGAAPEREKTGDSPSGYTEMKYDFPAPDAVAGMNASEMVYAIDLGTPSDEELEQLYAFTKCCDLDYSTPQIKLKSIFPGSRFAFSILNDNKRAALTISASGMNEDEAPFFRQAVMSTFIDMATNGISDDELEYFRNRMETDSSLAREGESAVINLLISIANYNSNGRGELFYINMRDRITDMKWFDNDLVKSICETYLASPKWSSMSVVVPKPGMYEESEEALAKTLSELKASMTDKEKKNLVNQTKRIIERSNDDPTKYLDELNVVGISDLADDIRKYDVTDSTDDKNVRHVGVYTDRDDLVVTRLYLDATGLTQDLLGYASLYADLINGYFVDTAEMERGEIPFRINEYTGRGQTVSCSVTSSGSDYRPFVLTEFMCSPDNLESAYELAYTRLFDSNFNDPAGVKEGITSVKNIVRSNIENNPDNVACYTAAAKDAEGIAYYEYTHYIEYYGFLTELEKNIGGDFKSICSKLEEVKKYLRNSDGAVVGYAIAKDRESDYLKCANGFIDKLDNKKREKCDYKLGDNKYPLAVITGSRVVSNAVAASDIIDNDLAVNSLVLGIMKEQYLEPMTRDRYGAYKSSCMDKFPAFAAFTADDPMTEETFSVMADMGKAWKVIRENMTQEDLDGYIITKYANESLSAGVISDSSAIISDVVSGRGADYDHRQLEILKKTKLSDLEKYDAFFEKLGQEGNRVTVGSKALIDANKIMYEQIIDPFAK